ncbi:hypothetical protein ACJJTC_006201 [Scirpophaga incertulas]
MDQVGSEIGHKMRSAIKAKLMELGCYVDDELPDYVMVMVANKRTRTQMEDDLQLFLGENTTLFVNWLHQVLKKLQEVTVTTPLKIAEKEATKETNQHKEKKSKEKKEKVKSKKSVSVKKSKKKEKSQRKKEEKKTHKSKKRSKHHEMIRPNVPPLLMNIEKVSEPSITDVFAGQILKSHGVCLESLKDEQKEPEVKPIVKEVIKRPIIPIIDPATITSQPDLDEVTETSSQEKLQEKCTVTTTPKASDEPLKEMNEIEAKIEGLKHKLAEQLDSMSEDEDFLNIRTEAEELMNDFAEDVFQEISSTAPQQESVESLPISKSPTVPKLDSPNIINTSTSFETLPQIELNLPKRPVRERLGAREEPKKTTQVKEIQKGKTPNRFTPDKEPIQKPQSTSVKHRLGDLSDKHKSSDDSSDKSESSSKRLPSRVSSVLETRSNRSCASVVRVRPRPRVATSSSSLLLKAVADAHKSLLTIPPKTNPELQKVKHALVLPMRRGTDPKIVIQVPADGNRTDESVRFATRTIENNRIAINQSMKDGNDASSSSITMKIHNSDYVPYRCNKNRTAIKKDDSLIIETLNIHNPTVGKDKSTQFIVTMDGYHPNAFLAKKLKTEGILNDEDELQQKPKEKTVDTDVAHTKEHEIVEKPESSILEKKRLSNDSEESDTKVIIKQEKCELEKKQINEASVDESNIDSVESCKNISIVASSSIATKRKGSPILFDINKKAKEDVKERVRTESASSDSQVIMTATNSQKYDSLPSLSQTERKLVKCRAFPLCRYGATCVFQHPRCKFAAACTRRGCPYSHTIVSPPPTLSSHVVPSANYKSISTVGLASLCKFYPNCVNPGCSFYHPKPCRYGVACLNKIECNFYHAEVATTTKWRYPV